SGGSVWGSGPYTSDSSICRAAIHAGVITDDDGGKVTLKISAGEKSYTGSKKNGVKTEDYGSFERSFTVK
ncbi:MAG: LCCL domain-containing protein, partial [Polyangiales bacterium]